jgi:hypothetical protein
VYGTSVADINATGLRKENGKIVVMQSYCALCAVSHATEPGYAFKDVTISTESAPGKTVVVEGSKEHLSDRA